MKLLKLMLLTAGMTTFAASAQAQDKNKDSGLYVNVGLQTLEFDTYSVVGRGGYNFSRNFGVEVEGSIGISGTDVGATDISDIEFTTPYSFGGYFVTRYPVAPKFELLGRLGFTNINFEVSDDFQSETENIGGFATGAGFQYNIDESNGLRADFTNVLLFDGLGGDFLITNATVIDVTFTRKF